MTFWLSARLDDGLQVFDIIGVAGNRRRMRRQPAWAFNVEMEWDRAANLSGGVGVIGSRAEQVSYYGRTGQPVRLLDGVFIAVKAAALIDRGVQFDQRFAFHFYDLDFCRSAEQSGLKLGTWPIAISHASGGAFGTRDWEDALKLYRKKWRD